MLTQSLHIAPRRFGQMQLTIVALFALLALLLGGCGDAGGRLTRTPVPTWTPTVGAPSNSAQAQPVVQQPAAATPIVDAPLQPLPADSPIPPTAMPPTPIPPTAAPPTSIPTDTPTPLPTAPPTETPTPVPTATPAYAFALEAAEKFPTQALAPNVVRVWMYVYSPAALGLGGYSLRVAHNGAPLAVDELSADGIPGATFDTPGPYTRFANLDVLFVEAQAGTWDVQLVDASGAPAGPPAQFVLSADEATRELYVRYKQTGALP